MRSGVIAYILQELRERFITPCESSRLEVNSLQNWHVLTYYLLLKLHSKIEKRGIRLCVPIRFARRNDHIGFGLPRSRQAEGSKSTEPTSIEHAALIENGRAVDADSIRNRLPVRMFTLEI